MNFGETKKVGIATTTTKKTQQNGKENTEENVGITKKKKLTKIKNPRGKHKK